MATTTTKKKPLRAVKEKLTKAALVTKIAEETELTRKDVMAVLQSLEDTMLGSIKKTGIGEFTLPGLLKINLRKVAARKAGTLIRNPATGEMMKAKAKPASVRVKVRALSKMKDAATS